MEARLSVDWGELCPPNRHGFSGASIRHKCSAAHLGPNQLGQHRSRTGDELRRTPRHSAGTTSGRGVQHLGPRARALMLCSQLCCVAGSSPMERKLRALRTQHNYLEGVEEGEQGRVVFPGFVVGRGRCTEVVGVCEDFGFPLQIDFGVDVGRVDGDVAEPGADGVDIDA